MNHNHITFESMERLLLQELSDDERIELISHLESDCQECSQFLEAQTEDFDHLVSLLYLIEDHKPQEHSFTGRARASVFNKVEAMLSQSEIPVARARSKSNGQWKRYVLPLAAMLILAVGMSVASVRYLSGPSGSNPKGDLAITGGPVFLQFLGVVAPAETGGIPEVRRGVNLDAYSEEDSLMFRYQLDHPSWVYIVRLDNHGDKELIFPAHDDVEMRIAGFHDAGRGDSILVYSLAGLQDLQTFCAVSSSEPVADIDVFLTEIESQIQLNIDSLGRIRSERLDCFQIKVERSWTESGLKDH